MVVYSQTRKMFPCGPRVFHIDVEQAEEEEAEEEELSGPEDAETASDDIARPEENEEEDTVEQDSEFHRLRSSHRYSLRPRAVRSNFLNQSEHFGLYHLAKLMGLAETLP